MEQYKFDRHYLKLLLEDSKQKYHNGDLSKKDYALLQVIINDLIYGNNQKSSTLKMDNLHTLNSKLNRLKEELGMNTIEKVFYISDSIMTNSSYFKLSSDHDKKSSKDLVTNVLKFYQEYNQEQYEILNKVAHGPLLQLEIVPSNFMNRKLFSTYLSALPFYNLDFVRIVKENRLYDEATLCHEFRHVIDIQKIDTWLPIQGGTPGWLLLPL